MSIIAKAPCRSCPYRKDVPSGVWAPEEYDKLPLYDAETFDQPFGAFYCHQQDGRLCAGWVGCHDMQESLGLRMAKLTPEDYELALDYESPVELFASGAEAAAHGKAEITNPSLPARRTIDRLARKRLPEDKR
jgi:hypothetical protein